MEEKRRMLWNAFAHFCLTPVQKRGVLSYFDTVENAMEAKDTEWKEVFALFGEKRLPLKEQERILRVKHEDYEALYHSLAEKEIRFVTEGETEFPEQLLPLYDAPRWLYYKGNLPKEPVLLAVVGARNCTPYGREVAKELARQLAEQGVGIVSGLAYGVDGAAHAGALRAGGATYGVLGCGADICYPAANKELYDAMCGGRGGVLSEYPPGTGPLSWLFPQRNRIIAGLSHGVLVTEAKKRSGTLITVSLGLEYGKNIYAVPGRITDVVSEGCNYLIKEGAKPVVCARDILEDFEEKLQGKGAEKTSKKCRNYENFKNILASEEKIVYASLRLMPKHIEEIQQETKLAPKVLAHALMSLCERGYIKRYGQAQYALTGDNQGFLSER